MVPKGRNKESFILMVKLQDIFIITTSHQLSLTVLLSFDSSVASGQNNLFLDPINQSADCPDCFCSVSVRRFEQEHVSKREGCWQQITDREKLEPDRQRRTKARLQVGRSEFSWTDWISLVSPACFIVFTFNCFQESCSVAAAEDTAFPVTLLHNKSF